MSTFDRETDAGQPLTLEDFHDAPAPATPDDRRREPRFTCDKSVAIRPCLPAAANAADAPVDNDDRPFRPARLLDCSVHGLGLFLDQPLHPGDHFLVKFEHRGRPILARYVVRHCRPVANRYIVGAALTGFLPTPDHPDAQTLLGSLLHPTRPWPPK